MSRWSTYVLHMVVVGLFITLYPPYLRSILYKCSPIEIYGVLCSRKFQHRIRPILYFALLPFWNLFNLSFFTYCQQYFYHLVSSNIFIFLLRRECVSTDAAGARTRRSLGHHLLHPLILRLLVLCAPAVLRPRALQDAPAPADPNS